MIRRQLAAEFLGTAFLLIAIVGSGIVTATDGAAPTQLFQHAVVVGAALAALITTFGPVSGAHFNPVVTLVDLRFGGLIGRVAARYVAAQVLGAVTGVVVANAMFAASLVAPSSTARVGAGLVAGEVVATFGLVLVIFGTVRSGNLRAVPAAVGTYIAAAIFFTSSASFANPAVTVARALTDTWTGIAPAGVPGFLAGQALGGVLAAGVVAWLFAPSPEDAADVVVPHPSPELERSTMADGVSDTPSVLFLCVHNAGRSQMAAGWVRHLAGDRVEVRSAGSTPGDAVNPMAVAAMAEVGIDIADQRPRGWDDDTLEVSDVIVTMGCGDTCPVLPGKRYVDWELDDPAGRPLEEVRPVRDEIERRVRGLLAELGVEPAR